MRDCNSYTEFGVNQGTTLAVALLGNIKKVRAYDMTLVPYNKAKHLFDDYSIQNSIDLKVFETDTLRCEIDDVDLLYIDTKHYYDHLTKELSRHGHKAKKYIVFHDTVEGKGLDRAVKEFVQKNNGWKIITDCKLNVGFMSIKRI